MEVRPRNEPWKYVQGMFHENKFKEKSTKKGQGTIHKDVQGTIHKNGLDWARAGEKVDRMI
jgi:hypothetical protein